MAKLPTRKTASVLILLLSVLGPFLMTLLNVQGETTNFFQYSPTNLDNVKFYQYFSNVYFFFSVAASIFSFIIEIYRQKTSNPEISISTKVLKSLIYAIVILFISITINGIAAIILYPPM